jgi:hypothetical protein
MYHLLICQPYSLLTHLCQLSSRRFDGTWATPIPFSPLSNLGNLLICRNSLNRGVEQGTNLRCRDWERVRARDGCPTLCQRSAHSTSRLLGGSLGNVLGRTYGNATRRSENCHPGLSRSSGNWPRLKTISHQKRRPPVGSASWTRWKVISCSALARNV